MKRPLLLFLIMVFPCLCRAESIYLRDGRVIEGEVISETKEATVIRESRDFGFVDVEYKAGEIKSIGTPPDEEQKKPQGDNTSDKDAKSLQQTEAKVKLFEEPPDYLPSIGKIIGGFDKLNSSWNADHFNYTKLRTNFNETRSLIDQFEDKYAKIKLASYSYMKLAFVELNNFEVTLDDMERTTKMKTDARKGYAPGETKNTIDASLKEYEAMGSEALARADKYFQMVQGRISKAETSGSL